MINHKERKDRKETVKNTASLSLCSLCSLRLKNELNLLLFAPFALKN